MSQFSNDIAKFNGIYKLPVSAKPTLDVGIPAIDRLKAFKNILAEELDEIDDIVKALEAGTDELDVLTMLADLLGDLQVYCASEMLKFGLPIDNVLTIIMHSNFSKLGLDGKPIYDARGKVLKGPHYWKPEPLIRDVLAARAAGGDPSPHPDDMAIDLFALAMKEKMAVSRRKGRGGWEDPAVCSVEFLKEALAEHVVKGDPVDVGNFAMMIFNRNLT